jgi:hypothetical protein
MHMQTDTATYIQRPLKRGDKGGVERERLQARGRRERQVHTCREREETKYGSCATVSLSDRGERGLPVKGELETGAMCEQEGLTRESICPSLHVWML